MKPRIDGVSNTLTTVTKDNLMVDNTTQETFMEKLKNKQLRVRKLTPKECWRLMAFDDEDYEQAAYYTEEEISKLNLRSRKNGNDIPANEKVVRVSQSQLYKQAGNSIVVDVLVAIFGQLFEGKEEYYKDVPKPYLNEETTTSPINCQYDKKNNR